MDPQPHEGIYTEKFLKVICIGAGASGILLAYKLNKHFDQYSLTIYEKNSDISGTWHENTYPGCACDVPAHNYTYSFDPKHDWPSVYASSSEIKAYLKTFCAKHALSKYIRTSHLVERASWLESKGEWEVSILDTQSGHRKTDHCHVLIYACGYLNNWEWPNVPGREKFKGSILHSAQWDHTTSLTGKTIALLGSGSSAIQILPKIQPEAKQVITFNRSPVWILPTISSDPQSFTRQQMESFQDDPDKLTVLRKYNENVMNSIYSLYLADSKLQSIIKLELEHSMKEKLNDADLEDALIPKWGVGCRRLSPSTRYLESVKQNNVRVIKAGVSSFTPEGCMDDKGENYKADVIICATGFNTSFVPRFPIIGRGQKNLQHIWAETPSSYLGVGVSQFPNFLMFLGPYSPVANGPTVAAIEAQADYILGMLDRYQTEPMHSFVPSSPAELDFKSHVEKFMQGTVYNDACRSGHKNHTVSGRVPTLWPGSTLHYLQTMMEFRGEDWDIKYKENRFSFLGNGLSHAEFDSTSDLAYYIREKDDGLALTRRGKMRLIMRSGSQPPRVLHRTHRPSTINLTSRPTDRHRSMQVGDFGLTVKEHIKVGTGDACPNI